MTGDPAPAPPSRPRPAAAARLLLVVSLAALAAIELLDRPPDTAAGPAAPATPSPARVEAALDAVGRRFHAVERAALERADALAPAVLRAVPQPTLDPSDRAAVFDALARALPEPADGALSGAVVVDVDGDPIAWRGRTFGPPEARPPGERRSTRVIRTNVYKAVEAEVPLTGPGGDVTAAIRVHAPFDVRFPLDNRWLRRVDFEREAEEALGLEDVDLIYDVPPGLPDEPAPAGRARGPLEGVLGDAHGIIEIEVPPPDAVAALDRDRRSRSRRALIALGALLAALLDVPRTRQLRRRALRGLARAGVVATVRVVLLVTAMPGDAAGGPLFSPSTFSVTWLGGLLRTPGDALLTAAAVLLIALFLGRALPRAGSVRRAAMRVLATVAAAGILVYGLGAAVDLAHAAAFQSRVDLFPEGRVLATAPAAALHLAVGALAAASLLLAVRLAGTAAGRRLAPRSRFVGALVLALVAGTWANGALQWQALRALRDDALAEFDRRRGSGRAEQEAAAAVLVQQLAERGELAHKVSRGMGPRPGDAAFFVWAETPELNGRAGGCVVELQDGDGTLLSRFGIEMPPPAWLPPADAVPADAPDVEVAVRPGRRGAAGAEFLVARGAIRGKQGRLRGRVRLVLPLDATPGGADDRPAILRSHAGPLPPPEGRALHFASFDGDRLRTATHPAFPRGMRAPPEAVAAVIERGEPEVWLREEIAGEWYHHAYLPAEEDGRVVGLHLVGFPSLTARPLLLNLARVVFLHLLGLAAVALASGAAALLRGWRPRPSLGFRTKVLVGFVLVGAVPVAGLAAVQRALAEERTHDRLEQEVYESLILSDLSLREAGVLDEVEAAIAGGDPVDEGRVQEVAHRIGVPINLFRDDRLLASSERGIFATEMFSPRLAGEAYHQIVLLGREAYAAQERFGSWPFLVGYAPLRDADGRTIGVLSVPLLWRQDRADRDLARTTTAALAIYLVVLLLVAVAGAVLARRMAGPVESLADGTRRVAEGELDFRLPRGPGDELGDLVDSFNRMTEGLAAGRDAAARAEREAAWREMAKQVAHEIKNPLTPMRLHAQHLLRAREDGREDLPDMVERAAATILRQTDALQRIATDFSAFARLPRRQPEPLAPADLVRDAASLWREVPDVEVRTAVEDDLPAITADREEMRMVLINLCGNAVEAMDGGGTLTLRAARDAGGVVMEIEDTGHGISAEDLERLFEPSFSTKTRGTGLGLAIVRRAVEDADGRIAIRSTPGEGTTATLHFPPA